MTRLPPEHQQQPDPFEIQTGHHNNSNKNIQCSNLELLRLTAPFSISFLSLVIACLCIGGPVALPHPFGLSASGSLMSATPWAAGAGVFLPYFCSRLPQIALIFSRSATLSGSKTIDILSRL